MRPAELPSAPGDDEPVTPTDPALSSKTAEPDLDWKPTKNPNLTVVPGQMRSDREEIPAGFTKEEADQAEIAEARAATSRSFAGCQYYWPSPHAVCGAIRDEYNSLGGPASFLSYPNSPELTNPDGHGKRTQFLNGPIYWSAATGAHPVVNSFLNRWGVHGYEGGWLGYPTTDEIVHADGVGRHQEFQGGAIYVAFQNAIGSTITGAIRDKWNSVGAHTPGSLLGYPTSDEIMLPDGQGRMNRFERGVIYWHPSRGAHPVTGGILDIWASSGYEQGEYGYPTGDAVNQAGTLKQGFENGWIHLPSVTVPIASTGASMSFGFPYFNELIAAATTEGETLQGHGIGATFRHDPSGSMGLELNLNDAQAPSQFKLAVGLPSGLSWKSTPTGYVLTSAGGRELASISDAIAFDALGNRVTVTSSIQGNEITYQFHLGPSPAYPIRSFRFVAGDRIENYLEDFGKLVTCVRVLGGDPDSGSSPQATACQRAQEAANNAATVAEGMYGQKDSNGNEWLDGEEDAMRHCLWNAFMAQDGLVGPADARKISRLHEAMNPNEQDSAEMDFHNNEFGVSLYENGLADTSSEAVTSCDNGIFYGELIVLNPNP